MKYLILEKSIIPTTWDIKRLKYLVALRKDRAIELGDLPYICLENIESWTGSLVSSYLPVEVLSNLYLFKEGDILFGKLRPYLAKVFCPNFEGVTSSEIVIMRSRGSILPKYLLYYMLNKDYIYWLQSLSFGSKMPRVSPEQVANSLVVFPHLADQHIVVEFLNQEMVKINKLVEEMERLIKLLQVRRSSLINHTITKGLSLDVDFKDSDVYWLGNIPTHWEVKRLKFLASFRNERVKKYDNHLTIGLENIESWTGKIILLNQEQKYDSNLLKFSNNDVLFGKLAPYLAKSSCPDFNGYCTSDIVVMRPTDKILKEFLMYSILNSNFILNMNSLTYGVRMPRVSPEQIANARISCPPLREQRAIVKFLQHETGRIDGMIEKIGEAVGLLWEYRVALISAAMTGQIDVQYIKEKTVKE